MKVGDVGTLIELETGTDLSGGTNAVIRYQKRSGATGSWSASVTGTKIQYSITDGDLDETGSLMMQGYVELAAWKGFTEKVFEEVGEVISV